MTYIRELIQFFKDAWTELKLVSWLSTQQMVASTSLVLILIVVFSIYVGALDFVISKLFAFFI